MNKRNIQDNKRRVNRGSANAGLWPLPTVTPKIDDIALLARWNIVIEKVRLIARDNDWSKSEIARQSDVAVGTFSQFYNGNYPGRYEDITVKIEAFVALYDEIKKTSAQIPKKPGYQVTRTAQELFDTFTYAQMLPTIVAVTLSSGMGKTMTATQYQDTRPHVHVVTMRPSTKSIYAMTRELTEVLGLKGRDQVARDEAIVTKLTRESGSTLLIVDEAQNLAEPATAQLRYYSDMAKCGMVLIGNEEVLERYAVGNSKTKSPQMQSRIGRRMYRLKPYPEDINALVAAWALEDEGAQNMAVKIANKAGALRTLSETIQAAAIIAAGRGRAIQAEDMVYAWENRSGEAI